MTNERRLRTTTVNINKTESNQSNNMKLIVSDKQFKSYKFWQTQEI